MTGYRVAESEADYDMCRKMMREEGILGDISFPTIMAIDNEELVGFLATRPVDDMIYAAPLMVRADRRRGFTLIRLIEHYRTVMRNLGITSVIINVDSENSMVGKGLQRWFPEMTPYARTEEGEFFVWRIDHGDT